jgi:acyl dehydratase
MSKEISADLRTESHPTMPARRIERLEELASLVGQEVGVGDWFEVTQGLIDSFADLTRDRQWIHVDPARAQLESPYGTTIAHGFLTLALVSHLHGEAVQVRCGFSRAINYGLNRVRFPAAVPAGARIRAHSTLQSIQEVRDGVQLVWGLTIEVEGQEKPALAAEWLVRLYR